MARQTVDQIMTMVAATVNQEATSPSAGSSEYNLWLEYINRAIDEWGQAHDWDVLRQTFYPVVTGISVATVSLPDNFRKLSGAVKLGLYNKENWEEFPIELPERTGSHSANDKFLIIQGDTSVGRSLLFHPGTLASGASLAIPYFATPTSVASPAQITPVPDPQFVTDRTIAYIFESRSDPRFQIVENKARDRLLMMIENANAATYDSYSNQNPIQNTLQRINFRIGRN